MVHDQKLDAASLAALRTLILPNVAALSDAQCAQLAEFVRAGGGLVATSETSLCDEKGVPRDDFGLADLFGASFVRRMPGPVRNGYPPPRARERQGPPAPRGPRGRPRIIHGAWLLDVKPTAPSRTRPSR
jgi:hypothetical protein